jgi:hypothetical protein
MPIQAGTSSAACSPGAVLKTELHDIPVCNSVAEAMEADHHFNLAVVYLPPGATARWLIRLPLNNQPKIKNSGIRVRYFISTRQTTWWVSTLQHLISFSGAVLLIISACMLYLNFLAARSIPKIIPRLNESAEPKQRLNELQTNKA